MRKLLIALFVALAAVSASAQKIGSYELKDKTYELSLLPRTNGSYMLLIEVPAGNASDAKLAVSKNDIPKFKKYLNEVLEKSMDWKLTAINNNVDDFDKIMPNLKSPDVRVFYHYGDKSCLSNNEPMRALFLYMKKYQHASVSLMLDGVAFDNQYIQANVSLDFVYLEELANFINAIDLDAIERAVKQKQVTDDLFQ